MKKITDDCIGCGMCAEICENVMIERRRAHLECADCEECLLDEWECPGRAIIPA